MSQYDIDSTKILLVAEKLGELFHKSELYKDYCQYKKTLENDPFLLERVAVYKKAQFDLETRRLQGDYISLDDEKRMSYHYTELSLHPIAGKFLTCEYELLNLYRRAMDIVSDACEI